MPSPTLELRGTYDEWFAAKSSSFRKQMRRVRRQVDERGAVFRLALSDEELERAIRSFAKLHAARWDAEGGSAVLRTGVEPMLREAARELARENRFRLFSLELDDRAIACQIVLAAGDEAAHWLGGFDEAWAVQQPSIQTILAAIEHAFRQDEQRFNLGAGAQPHKYRLADGEEILHWVTLVPGGPRQLFVRCRLVPERLRRALGRRLSPRQKARIRRLIGRRRSA